MTNLIVSLADIPETVLVPAKYLSGGSVGAQIAYGRDVSLMIATRQPGYHSKPHLHDAEQLNYVLEGELQVFVENTSFLAKKGDVFRIPRNVVHWSWVQGNGPCVLFETHSPPLVGDPGVTDTAVALMNSSECETVTGIASQWPADFDLDAAERTILRSDGERGANQRVALS
jgi:quercetin dioxygenase-like cupin family protein